MIPPLLLLFSLQAAAIVLPADAPTAGRAFDEASLAGGRSPWRSTADQEGMQENWTLLPGLASPLTAGTPEGPNTLESAGWTGPSLYDSIDLIPRAGLGGAPWLSLRPASTLTDTPMTRLSFWRGAVGAYRFGLDLERSLTRDIGLHVATQNRSYPSRRWSYTDQVKNWYTWRDSIPSHGRTAGLEDMRWEVALTHALPGGHLDGGWRMTDWQRGFPDPQRTDSTEAPPSGTLNSQEGFVRWSAGGSSWSTEGGISGAAVDITRPQLLTSDTTTSWTGFSGSHFQGNANFLRKRGKFSAGPEALFIADVGTRSSTAASWSEFAHREGLTAAWGDSGFTASAGGGLTSASVDGKSYTLLPDGNAHAGWNGQRLGMDLSAVRTHRLPLLTETVLGDADTRWAPSSSLLAEHRTVLSAAARLSPCRFFQVDGRADRILLDDRLAPSRLTTSSSIGLDSTTLVLGNIRGRSEGYGLGGGIRLALGGWQLRGEFYQSSLRDPDGNLDHSSPRMQFRTWLDWQGLVLHDHMRLQMRAGIHGTSDYRAWTVSTVSDSHVLTTEIRMPSQLLADLETGFTIGSFSFFWNLQNLGAEPQAAVPGWTSLGLQSGFGIRWSLAG